MEGELHPNEDIKARSQHLRGTLRESLVDPLTGALSADDTQLSKFHGFYEQDDRDLRVERQQQFLEPYYSFMLRARLPGGVCTPEQWLAIDATGRELANGTIRLTTRQTFQFHGILKKNLKPLIQRINQAMIDSISGCGDVNRNILCDPNPERSELHAEVYGWAKKIAAHLLPKTRAYHEIWLDDEPVAGGETEPLYGETYLPRKFKTAIAIPPRNDVDVYTNDLGFIAIAEGDHLLGFNVVAGGGMGTTHEDSSTYPRLADELGFIQPDDAIAVAEAVLTTQRDFGNRVSRRHARLKYTIDRMGLDAFVAEVEKRSEVRFETARSVEFTTQVEQFGWAPNADGSWHLTLYIENGRVADGDERKLMTGLRTIAQQHKGEFRITANQNLIVANVPQTEKSAIEDLARAHGLLADGHSPTRLASIACVALPTCSQAMAESERYFPALLDKIDKLSAEHGIGERAIVMRMTGCPNGCARPFAAEVGLVGKGPGRYNLHLGGDGRGQRIARLYRKNLNEADILGTLDKLFADYAEQAQADEGFGDFLVRTGVVAPVINAARDYHESA